MAKFEIISITREDLFRLMGDPDDKINPLRIGELDRNTTVTECFIKFINACIKINDKNLDAILSSAIGLKPI